ncbi:hypothetical protein HanHA300_Chr12g0461621 [Helianthus annuus]|nr:hypothetical protein HanHA300_Chr12g0461621 [Helianthus annuus]KAJ0676512.1 hypothetical protein HanLR1_Chr12g0463641 [Helianthus annuus]KAJ0679724.1 hypothetical protein HanOQP8_Chr12g0462871 [Helianthus annuus]
MIRYCVKIMVKKMRLTIWKKELDNMEAQYLCWHSELQNFREAAIEDAKRQWNLKNKDARSLFELQSLDEKNDIRFKGERNEENTVTLPLRIAYCLTSYS